PCYHTPRPSSQRTATPLARVGASSPCPTTSMSISRRCQYIPRPLWETARQPRISSPRSALAARQALWLGRGRTLFLAKGIKLDDLGVVGRRWLLGVLGGGGQWCRRLVAGARALGELFRCRPARGARPLVRPGPLRAALAVARALLRPAL